MSIAESATIRTMNIIADLHIHSKYSRAVSQRMDLREIGRCASQKGISLVSTGDWTHPQWISEIASFLVETQEGIFSLKTPHVEQKNPVSFMLSTEISSIYTQGGKQRRIHSLIFSPSLSTCEKINTELKSRGANLRSDGRPIVGLSAKDILELVLTISPKAFIIPAHVWTPWFSLYGSNSGFDSVAECFGETNAQHIYGVETGLSSDPIMNWKIPDLNTRSILSFSDAHSGPKLGREATVFIGSTPSTTTKDVCFETIKLAIMQKPGPLRIGYTIEFFPEEGKYHWSGHRVCNVRLNPEEIKKKGTLCPVCKKKLTVGVESRVNDLSSETNNKQSPVYQQNSAGLTFVLDADKKRRPFVSLVPLLEILIELNNKSPTKGLREYTRIIELGITEFDILLRKSYDEISRLGGQALSQAIQAVRERKVHVEPGYDGVFGTVRIQHNEHITQQTGEENKKQSESQTALF